ncbi:hypothetical protein DdX_11272 [Ditylenchus destructor]|uniref:Uncharacterized protein n=1 Tax=Ditylenchus destructor TaxID=166010 RepID=A0AAD4N0H1_9BILA|nr:hypothetical protein DdX_11272 [Ditylenchus destructor]
MHKSVQPAAKKAKVEDESRKENECKSKKKTSNIATLDNGTMVETFKYLNYCQLAKNGLVTKRFRNMIQTHRHTLAILYVRNIDMYSFITPAAMKVFDKQLSPEAYDEWVISNNYSKQIPLKDQVASTQSAQNTPSLYRLSAQAYYKGPMRKWDDITVVFTACVALSHDNWPSFQYFACLATDPFIYIENLELSYQNDVLNLLAEAINSNHDRFNCKQLIFHIEGNSQKAITWIKNHVRCKQVSFDSEIESNGADLNEGEHFLDFFVTGAQCTSTIIVDYRDISRTVFNFVQKFMDLPNSDEIHFVTTIEGYISEQTVEMFKRNYSECFVQQDHYSSIEYVFQFVNNKVGQMLQLTAEITEGLMPFVSIKINDV